MNPGQLVSFDSMNLQVGGRIQVLLVRDVKPVQYFSTLIGYSRNEYLILKAPVNGNAQAALREGDKLTLRAFTGTNVCSFHASVMRIFGAPLHYVHLSFPDQIFSANLRRALRVKVDIPARVGTAAGSPEPAIAAVLGDLSMSGARIECETELGREGEVIPVAFHGEGPQTGLSFDISTRAVIRNVGSRSVEEASPKHTYGVEFVDLDTTQQIMLQNLTFQAVVDNRQNIV